MRFDVITLFPELIRDVLSHSILGRAQEDGKVEIHLHQLRDYATDKHRTVDDRPFGGGPGMLLKCEPVFVAIEAVRALTPEPGKVVLMTPTGGVFNQTVAREWSITGGRRIVLCGHYEGMDERIREHLVDEEISIGDFVLTNGALAAAVVVDAVTRLLPGVLGNEGSTEDESFCGNFLECPHYTRPAEFRGWQVPEILLSGNHAEIAAWRKEQSRRRTEERRPDLMREENKKVVL